MDEIRISPAGDPFYAVGKHRPNEATEETPHGCYEGYHYFELVAEDGDEEGETIRVPCRRCNGEAR